MTIVSRDPFPKAAPTVDEPHRSENSPEDFRRLMKVEAVDADLLQKNLYELIEEEEEIALAAPCPPPLLPLATPISATSILLPVAVEELFEKTASVMIVMHSAQEKETTLFIDRPDSPFFGTRVTIREFSTAPYAFNIEIGTHPAAASTLEMHKDKFLPAFQCGNFPFSIHRLETHIEPIEDRPVFHRRESDQEQQEGGKQR